MPRTSTHLGRRAAGGRRSAPRAGRLTSLWATVGGGGKRSGGVREVGVGLAKTGSPKMEVLFWGGWFGEKSPCITCNR